MVGGPFESATEDSTGNSASQIRVLSTWLACSNEFTNAQNESILAVQNTAPTGEPRRLSCSKLSPIQQATCNASWVGSICARTGQDSKPIIKIDEYKFHSYYILAPRKKLPLKKWRQRQRHVPSPSIYICILASVNAIVEFEIPYLNHMVPGSPSVSIVVDLVLWYATN